ncbi:MAG: hypothetical protein ABI480_02270 [Chitinophagaceae bacterium]
MGKQVSNFIIQRLHEWGIKRIFGFPGDGINGITVVCQDISGMKRENTMKSL